MKKEPVLLVVAYCLKQTSKQKSGFLAPDLRGRWIESRDEKIRLDYSKGTKYINTK